MLLNLSMEKKEPEDSYDEVLKQPRILTIMKPCLPPLQGVLHFFCDFLKGIFF